MLSTLLALTGRVRHFQDFRSREFYIWLAIRLYSAHQNKYAVYWQLPWHGRVQVFPLIVPWDRTEAST